MHAKSATIHISRSDASLTGLTLSEAIGNRIRLVTVTTNLRATFARRPICGTLYSIRRAGAMDSVIHQRVIGDAVSPKWPLYGSTIGLRLGFLESFRTFWVAPQPELRVLMDKVVH